MKRATPPLSPTTHTTTSRHLLGTTYTESEFESWVSLPVTFFVSVFVYVLEENVAPATPLVGDCDEARSSWGRSTRGDVIPSRPTVLVLVDFDYILLSSPNDSSYPHRGQRVPVPTQSPRCLGNQVSGEETEVRRCSGQLDGRRKSETKRLRPSLHGWVPSVRMSLSVLNPFTKHAKFL